MKLVNSDILDRAVVETLETRQMLSAVSFDSGVLNLKGLVGDSNSIQLKLKNGRVMALVNGEASSRQLAGIHSITIVGGDKNDSIEIDRKISIPVTILARAGDDRVVAGGGRAQIEGGAGNDTIYGSTGHDDIQGNAGNDRLYGDKGNDTINGGVGNDLMWGNAGNDHFVNVERYDKLSGGGGSDSMTVDPNNRPNAIVDSQGNGNGNGNGSGSGNGNGNGNSPADTSQPDKPIPIISGFSLIDASTNKVIAGYTNIQSGSVLDLSKLPSKLAIGANLDGAASVRFDYDGKKMYRIENNAPYALGGDDNGKFRAMNFSIGKHTLVGHAVVSDTGEVLTSAGITFSIIKTATSSGSNSGSKPAASDGATKPGGSTGNSGNSNSGSNSGSNNSGSNGNNGSNNGNSGSNNGNSGSNNNPGTGNGNDNGTVIPPPSNTSGSTPDAKITAISTTIPAGTSLHVDALKSLLKSGDWNNGQYLWDFGDPGSRYNQLKGFNAAHTYDKAGQYTVTLTVVNEAGKQDKATLTVNVTSAARKVIYVSNDGSDNNSGLSQNSPIKSFAKAASLLDDNTEILFKRGDTFTLTKGMWISQNNVLVGAYGIGDRPTLYWNGDRVAQAFFNTSAGAQNITVQDLSIDTKFNQDTNDAGTPLGFSPNGKNITIRRNEFLNLQYGANLNQRPTGVMFQDNVAPLLTGIRKYFVWVEGSNISIVGNKAVNSTREHIVRVNYASKLLVMDNDFANVSRRGSGADYWDYRKTALNVQSGEFAYLADNKLDGPFQIGPLGKGDGLKTPDLRFKYAIAEGNTVINDSLEVNHGAEHITIRQNVFNVNGFTAINIDGYDSTYGRGIIDLVIDNNTGINNDSSGKFIEVHAHVDGFELTNNLYIAPNLVVGANATAGIKVSEGNLSSFTKIDGNIWPVAASVSSWVGEQAMNYIGGDYVKGFQTASEWNNNSRVGTDYFTNVTLNGRTFTTIDGKIIGASLAA